MASRPIASSPSQTSFCIHSSAVEDNSAWNLCMARVLIVGYGNPLRGDDAFGFLAAEKLRSEIVSADVEVLALHQLVPELMEPVSRAELAIFIDASTPSPSPGELAGGGCLTHHETPESLAA